MSCIRIVFLDFDAGRAGKGAILARLIRERNVEVVHAQENAGNGWTGERGDSHGDGFFSACSHAAAESNCLGEDDFELQNRWIVFFGDAGQVAGWRMTAAAFASAVEVDLAGFGVACEDVQDFVIGAGAQRIADFPMEEIGEVLDLSLGESCAGLATLRGVTFEQKGSDRAAVTIMKDDERADDVGTLGSSPPFRPVTGDALGRVGNLAV